MIAINAAILNAEPTGLGVFVKEIAVHISKQEKNVVIFTSFPDHFPQRTVYAAPKWVRTECSSLLGGLLRFLWNQIALPWLLWRKRAQVLLSPNHEIIFLCPCAQVAVIYDLIPLLYPENYPRLRYYFRFLLPWALNRVALIVAGSENTKRDLVMHYGVSPSKIIVIYPGVDKAEFHPFVIRSSFSSPSPYILYVGSHYGYKNLARLLEAYSRLVAQGFPHMLVIAGRKDPRYSPHLESTVRSLGLDLHVSFTGYISRTDLAPLYAQADLFVFPSLYEGFGLPVIEAMSCGCPVVASNVSSLPEVCGPAGRYFDPTDVSDMHRTIATVLSESELRSKMVEFGYEHAQQFSWEETAALYLKTLSGVCADFYPTIQSTEQNS